MLKVGKCYSWVVISEDNIIKNTDKSCFVSNESGIPTEIREFFECQNFEKGDNRKIKLHYNKREYDASITCTYSKMESVLRTKIIWKKDFTSLITLVKEKEEKFPEINFRKIDKYNFDIDFDSRENINSTLDSIVFSKEGNKIEYYTTKYERNPKYRKMAIEEHGLTCMVCGFNFEEKYGKLGEGYIEVHHVKPLYSLDEAIIPDPKIDLVCICSNCHRMIHRSRTNIMTIDELKSMLKK